MEAESEDGTIPFLDILIHKRKGDFITSIYRKPTFSGSYIKWNSFSPFKRKVSLVETITHRAMQICSNSTLPEELGHIRRIFHDNGYPTAVVEKAIRRKTSQTNDIYKVLIS